MKKRIFVDEDALSSWDEMTNDEEKQIQGGASTNFEQQSDSNQSDAVNVSVSWSKSF